MLLLPSSKGKDPARRTRRDFILRAIFRRIWIESVRVSLHALTLSTTTRLCLRRAGFDQRWGFHCPPDGGWRAADPHDGIERASTAIQGGADRAIASDAVALLSHTRYTRACSAFIDVLQWRDTSRRPSGLDRLGAVKFL